jgi:hypothetical protein
MGGGGGGLYRRGGVSSSTNLDVINDFDERQLLCLRFNEPAPPGRPRRGRGLGEASERARVWFTVLLLPASKMVYTKSTFKLVEILLKSRYGIKQLIP